MGDIDGGDAQLTLQGLDLALHLLAELLVQRSQRLIHQQKRGPIHQGTGQRDALLLSTGELAGITSTQAGHLYRGQDLLDPLGHLWPTDSTRLQWKRDVLEDGHVREECVALEDHADIALLGRARHHGFAAYEDLSARQLLEARDEHEGGGLAGAARPEKRDELALTDLQRHVVDRHGSPVGLRHTNECHERPAHECRQLNVEGPGRQHRIRRRRSERTEEPGARAPGSARGGDSRDRLLGGFDRDGRHHLLAAVFLEARLDRRTGLEICTLDFYVGRNHEHGSVGEGELGAAYLGDFSFDHLVALRARLTRGGRGALGERMTAPCHRSRKGETHSETKSNAPHLDNSCHFFSLHVVISPLAGTFRIRAGALSTNYRGAPTMPLSSDQRVLPN